MEDFGKVEERPGEHHPPLPPVFSDQGVLPPSLTSDLL